MLSETFRPHRFNGIVYFQTNLTWMSDTWSEVSIKTPDKVDKFD